MNSSRASHRIQLMLDSLASDSPRFPPTILYNEGWLLRLSLDWFSKHEVSEHHPLAFSAGSCWFSEALLPSAFLPRQRGDKLAESWTHADGIVGNIKIANKAKAALQLQPDANDFVVLEAKIFSKLSSGVTNARFFDQAARNVACVAEVLRLAGRRPGDMTKLCFCVLAPKSQIDQGIFGKELDSTSIRKKVEQRVAMYDGEKRHWLDTWFVPTLERIKLECLSWEEINDLILRMDPENGKGMRNFYELALKFNRQEINFERQLSVHASS